MSRTDSEILIIEQTQEMTALPAGCNPICLAGNQWLIIEVVTVTVSLTCCNGRSYKSASACHILPVSLPLPTCPLYDSPKQFLVITGERLMEGLKEEFWIATSIRCLFFIKIPKPGSTTHQNGHNYTRFILSSRKNVCRYTYGAFCPPCVSRRQDSNM